MRRAEKAGWTSEQLGQNIRAEIRQEPLPDERSRPALRFSKLIPKRGILYTYRLLAPDSVHNGEDGGRPWIDLGFQVHRKMPQKARGFKEGQIITSKKQANGYAVSAANSTEQGFFTYKAFVERVVDGDTLLARIDLGFETRVRQYLRLRGIDAPEISSPEGKKAKAFVERELAAAAYITITSSRSDKYDRYLADVFYGGPDQEIFLNQRLLDKGLAVRM